MATDAKPQTTATPSTPAADSGRRPYRFTAAQLWRMIETGVIPDHVDVELVRGRIYRMTKHEPHNFAVGEIADLIRVMNLEGFHLREEKSIHHDPRSMPEPDVAIVRGRRRDFRRELPTTNQAVLLVEVCVSTRRADYGEKLRLYASAGVPFYWVVDVDGRKIDVFTEPRGSGRDASYGRHDVFPEGQPAVVVLDGREVGRIDAKDLLPPIESLQKP